MCMSGEAAAVAVYAAFISREFLSRYCPPGAVILRFRSGLLLLIRRVMRSPGANYMTRIRSPFGKTRCAVNHPG